MISDNLLDKNTLPYKSQGFELPWNTAYKDEIKANKRNLYNDKK